MTSGEKTKKEPFKRQPGKCILTSTRVRAVAMVPRTG